MKRRIESLKPFPFESDFSAPKPADPELITLSAADLAALMAEARESAAAMTRDDALTEHAAQMEAAIEKLKDALAAIVQLAAHLESAAIDEADRQTALANVRKLASRLIDSQGDLFA